MHHERTIRSLRLQLLIERTVIAAAAAAIIAVLLIGHFRQTKSLILVDGQPVVCLSSQNDAEAVLQNIKTRTGFDPEEIQFRQTVRVTRAPRDAAVVSRHRAMRTVQRLVSPVVPRWAIIVDGKPVVAVPDRETAGEALELAKFRFGRMAKNLVEEPQFKQDVTVDIAETDPSIYCKSAEDAVRRLFSTPQPASKDAVYVVRPGDSASAIAARHGLPLRKLIQLNPGRELERLQVGDRIRVKTSGPAQAPLTVVVRDQSERVERVPAPVLRVSSAKLYVGKTLELSPGRAGERRVKVATIYENGRFAGSEILEEEILREPVPRQIAVGIKAYRR